eukprot:GDKJ01029038.1.p1 GENE.GDKJ01029038.1~~GDKJ01029038.1.p1  ORF type:complete len:550 (-),score=97.45 GDKJ01029038.1:490-2139(-)
MSECCDYFLGNTGHLNDIEITHFFSKYGNCTVDIKYHDAEKLSPRHFGYLHFNSPPSENIEGYHRIGQDRIRVAKAVQQVDERDLQDRGKKIFVGNVHGMLSQNEVEQYFSHYGSINSIHWMNSCCFITFESMLSVPKILSNSNHSINGVLLNVRLPDQRKTRRAPEKNSHNPFQRISRNCASDGSSSYQLAEIPHFASDSKRFHFSIPTSERCRERFEERGVEATLIFSPFKSNCQTCCCCLHRRAAPLTHNLSSCPSSFPSPHNTKQLDCHHDFSPVHFLHPQHQNHFDHQPRAGPASLSSHPASLSSQSRNRQPISSFCPHSIAAPHQHPQPIQRNNDYRSQTGQNCDTYLSESQVSSSSSSLSSFKSSFSSSSLNQAPYTSSIPKSSYLETELRERRQNTESRTIDNSIVSSSSSPLPPHYHLPSLLSPPASLPAHRAPPPSDLADASSNSIQRWEKRRAPLHLLSSTQPPPPDCVSPPQRQEEERTEPVNVCATHTHDSRDTRSSPTDFPLPQQHDFYFPSSFSRTSNEATRETDSYSSPSFAW